MARKQKSTAQRKALNKKQQYAERAKRMRPIFRDMFSAKSGFDLRSPDSWTPAQKAKVTKYFRVVAPNITGDFEVKRYRIPENMAAAVDASLQEKPLKGQTGAAFRVDPGEKLEIKIKHGVATVKQFGIRRIKLKFDKKKFLQDPKAEVNRVMQQTDAQVFRVLVGGQGQNTTLNRNEVMDEIMRLVEKYDPRNIRTDQAQRPFTDWLNGLIAYPGTPEKTYSSVDKFVQNHKKVMEEKRVDHLDSLSASNQNISVKTLRTRRTKRMRMKGRQ